MKIVQKKWKICGKIVERGKQLMRPENPKYPELWEVIVGMSGRAWLVPVDVPNKGDYIHCTNSKNWEECGEGYGGRTIEFKLETGGTFKLHGGWHSNSNSLLSDTQVDCTHLHYTHIDALVVYSDEQEAEIEYDHEGWCLDEFEREEDIKWFRESILPLESVKSMKITQYSIGGSSSFWMVK